MEKLTFKVRQFEGPLDLLLHLISKNKIDICDIPIAELLEQYLSTIEEMKRQNLEVASEFLEMAARLVYMKTVMLLPKQEEAESLKQELTGQLIEYAACKQAAAQLKERYTGGDIFVRQPADNLVDYTYSRIHKPELLKTAYLAAIGRAALKLPPPKTAFEGIIGHEFVPVESKESEILHLLQRRRTLNIHRLYAAQTQRSGAVAVFLALLELIKSGKIVLDGLDEIELAENPREGTP